MSKLLNDEQRVVTLRRGAAKDAFADLPLLPEPTPEPEPQPEPVQPAATAPATLLVTPPPAPAAPPLDRVPLPTMSPEALRYARRWYSTVSLFILAGVVWAVATIVRTNNRRHAVQTLHARPAVSAPAAVVTPPPAPPAQPVALAPSTPASRIRVRDPFTSALAPTHDNAALIEARRVYSLMESALRSAATATPEPSGD